MARSVITYDKDLPEIEERLGAAHLPPTSYLRRREGTDGFEEIPGRRPSDMLLVNRLRDVVGKWRVGGYEGASEVTRRLFSYWFEDSHLVNDKEFHFYFGQREALETLAYLVEVNLAADATDLIDAFGEIFYPDNTPHSLTGDITVQETPDGVRKLTRFVPDAGRTVTQDLPAPGLARLAIKMATGSGKTVVMAMAIVWAYFHKRVVENSPLSTNFLVVAPNVIVYQRLEKDLANNEVFNALPLVPTEWQGRFKLKTILRGDAAEPDPSGNLILINIQQIHESSLAEWTPANALDALLGRKPSGGLARERPLLERIHSLKDLVVLNDEAHHVHDEDLAWHKTLMGIHEALPAGLSMWLDFSATPKDQSGTYFPWAICDYPLAQAVEDRIVKAPLIVHQVDQEDPSQVSADKLIEAYGDLLQAALKRFKEHRKTYKQLGLKPVLFIMTEKNTYADKIGEWLRTSPGTGMRGDEVLVIHTKGNGEIQQGDLEKARRAARDIDLPDNEVKAIVSVMMLREGWDVRSVSIVLGLRPFTAEARILPEQAVGRGLRLMEGVGPDRTQTLEVLGSRKFEEFVRGLETEGVGIKTVSKPKQPVTIYPLQQRAEKDITIPLTGPIYSRNYARLSDLDPFALEALAERPELDEPARIKLKMEFATTQTEVHQADIAGASTAPVQEVLASITNKVRAAARLDGVFAELYPVVEKYVTNRCFGQPVVVEGEIVLSHLRRAMIQQAIADYLAKKIGNLTAERRAVELKAQDLKLSDTQPFQWRRDLPAMESDKTIFNLVATFNAFERRFATALHSYLDITRFAALGTTGQEAGTRFRVEFLKPSGALGLYHPDFVAVQEISDGEVDWIIETKGRVWEDTEAKDAAISHWCNQVGAASGKPWRFVRVNQIDFENAKARSFEELQSKLRDTASRADSVLPEGDDLAGVAELYELKDEAAVEDFLKANDFLVDLLLEAHPEIESRFGRDASLALDVIVDPEAEEEESELVLLIETSLDRKQARALRDSLDREWWLEVLPAARHRMTIHLQYC